MLKLGKIGESSVRGERLRIPKAVKLYLKLKGDERIEWLTHTTDLSMEELADDCLIIKVKRDEKK
jgi:hypothetical protein